MKKVAMALTFMLGVVGFSATAMGQEKFHWRLQSNLNSGEPGYVAVEERFAKLASDMSGGRITFDVYPVGTLFPVSEGLEAVASGMAEVAVLTGGYYAGKIGPFASLESGVPGSLRTPLERYNFFYKKGFLDLARDVYGQYGVYYLGPQLSPQWDIMSKKPIESIDDFKGLKIRSFGLEANWYESMGATPVFMGGGEVYTALATGVIDAARWASPTGNYNNSFQEVAKYYVAPSPLPVPNNFFAVNQAAWDKLPADLQAILNEAAIASSFDYLAIGEQEDAKTMQKMLAEGVQISTIPEQEWEQMEEAARKLWREYEQADQHSAQAVQMLNEYLAELGR